MKMTPYSIYWDIRTDAFTGWEIKCQIADYARRCREILEYQFALMFLESEKYWDEYLIANIPKLKKGKK